MSLKQLSRPAIVFAIWTVPGLLSCMQAWTTARFSGQPLSFLSIAAEQMPGWYLWAMMTPLLFRLADRFQLRRPLPAEVFLAHGIGWILALALQALLIASTAQLFGRTSLSFPALFGRAITSWVPSTFLLYCATVGTASWIRSVQREREREREQARMSEQLARAELAALRSQLHPHFLFNTLNTIAILIREGDAQVAERLVAQLGDVLREVLRSSRVHETSLNDEIRVIRTYLEIESLRFGDRLSVCWRVEPRTLDASVPVLLLQPLVENALRHGIAYAEGVGQLEIGAAIRGERLVLWVGDNGPGPEGVPERRRHDDAGGVGLENTARRLEQLYTGTASFALRRTGGQTRAEVELPLGRTALNQPIHVA